MRYLGNKKMLLDEIEKLVLSKIKNKDLTFFDAFSGTGSVSDYMKKNFKVIANDYLYTSYILTTSKLNNSNVKFKMLKIDPFEYFNDISEGIKGFIYENYSPDGKGGRMYFTSENAKKIDFIRMKIEEWRNRKLINKEEYNYLIACLIESVSKVSNIAGVYGSYLKYWDNRAVKKMKFLPIEREKNIPISTKNKVYNEKLEDIIDKLDYDILYLDPPYTKNQYSTQYHLLETISKNDNPEINGKTGGRIDTKEKRSSFSIDIKAHIEFENLVKKTKAKYIVMSYSSAGLMSKDYIESVLKRYGKKESYEFKKILYKKYLNHKTSNKVNHFEYLFFIEKKSINEIVYNSPLNYIGGKGKMIEIINKNLPLDFKRGFDIFGGGFNVGVNLPSEKTIYNDINYKVKELLEMFKSNDVEKICKDVIKIIKKFNLKPKDKIAFNELRKYYNETGGNNSLILYVLILFGFQQQIRFNSKLEYNNTVGMSGFNDKILEKIISFSGKLKEKNMIFYSENFEKFGSELKKGDFLYCDPPYLITLGSYNDGKRGFNGWTEKDEIKLLNFLDSMERKKVKFMLSNVIEHKDKKNEILNDWISKKGYKVIEITCKNRKEVLIKNY